MLLSTAEGLTIIARVLARLATSLEGSPAETDLRLIIRALGQMAEWERTSPAQSEEGCREADALNGRITQIATTATAASPSPQDPSPEERLGAWADILDRRASELLDAAGASAQGDAAALAILHDIARWENRYFDVPPPATPGQDVPAEAPRLTAERLQALLRTQPDVGPNAIVSDYRAVSGGLTKETYLFTLHRGGTAEKLVVRKDGARPVLTMGAYDIANEYVLQRCAFAAGLPAPEPLWCFAHPEGVDGGFFIMRAVEGEVAGTPGTAFGDLSVDVLLQLATYLARIHSAPLEAFDAYIRHMGLEAVYRSRTSDWLKRQIGEWVDERRRAIRKPAPSEAFMAHWLITKMPARAAPPSLVHSDCSFHNILRDGETLRVVLDWESSHFGDPAEDLAYIHDMVIGTMDWQAFLDHYHAQGGPPDVTLDRIRYFKTFLAFRNTFAVNKSVCRFKQGYYDARLLPLALDYFPLFRRTALEAIETSLDHSQE